MFLIFFRRIRCRLDISGLVGFWCVFIGCILENTGHDLTGITRVVLSSLFICWIYSLCVWLLGNEYLVFYLYNKSAIIEHHFTVGGLFDFVYCVCTLLRAILLSGRREPKYGNSGAGCRTSHCIYVLLVKYQFLIPADRITVVRV